MLTDKPNIVIAHAPKRNRAKPKAAAVPTRIVDHRKAEDLSDDPWVTEKSPAWWCGAEFGFLSRPDFGSRASVARLGCSARTARRERVIVPKASV